MLSFQWYIHQVDNFIGCGQNASKVRLYKVLVYILSLYMILVGIKAYSKYTIPSGQCQLHYNTFPEDICV